MPYQPFQQRKGVISSDRLDHIEHGLARVAEGGGEIPAWGDIPEKPASFPPESHTHQVGEVDGLQSALDGKADAADIPEVPEVPSTDFADLAGSVDGTEGATLQAILTDMAARIQTLEAAAGGDD